MLPGLNSGMRGSICEHDVDSTADLRLRLDGLGCDNLR
jgi:hypothetical protein